MERKESSIHSSFLQREMRYTEFGTKGLPLVFFAAQNGSCHDYEECGMIECISDYIDRGKLHVFCLDSADRDSFSDIGGDNPHRTYIQEMFYHYVSEEMIPLIRDICKDTDQLPFLSGVSAGANQATIQFLRRPDLYSGFLALSTVIDIQTYFFGSYCDERLYNNAPLCFLPHMSKDHPYIRLYNQKKMIFCIGQGAWEEGVNDLRRLQSIMEGLDIHATFDYWGYDVCHDWCWWDKQIRYFLPRILEK